MVDWAYVNGMAEEYGHGDPDHDMHDPAGHCGGGAGQARYNAVYHGKHGTPYSPFGNCRRCGQRIEFIHTGLRWRVYEVGATKLHSCSPPPDASEFAPIKD